MTYQQFVTSVIGRYKDFDGKFGSQCVDLIRFYIRDVLAKKPYDAIPPIAYAKYAFTNYNKKVFVQIKNSPSNSPKQGDFVVWGWSWPTTGYAGHIAICDKADVNNLWTLDQNYPTGKPCQFVKHSYRGVLGWLRAI